jgi:hypothetical protein
MSSGAALEFRSRFPNLCLSVATWKVFPSGSLPSYRYEHHRMGLRVASHATSTKISVTGAHINKLARILGLALGCMCVAEVAPIFSQQLPGSVATEGRKGDTTSSIAHTPVLTSQHRRCAEQARPRIGLFLFPLKPPRHLSMSAPILSRSREVHQTSASSFFARRTSGAGAL